MKKVLVLSAVLLTPALALAQDLSNLQRLATSFGEIVDTLIPVVFAIALLVFFWGLAKYILAAGSEEAKAEGRRIMIGGIIALFIMSAIWGIVTFIGEATGIDTDPQDVQAPGVQIR